MHIVYVSDGKAGHRSQALGLYKAMQRQSAEDVTFEEVSIEKLDIFSLLICVFKHSNSSISQAPDFIFGVGSHTQLRVLLLGKIYSKAKTVILMKPNFPFSWFDYAIIPEHDDVQASAQVITTKGALNPIVNEQGHQSNRILIALGGSSKRHQWNNKKVLDAIKKIVYENTRSEIILTTSRRTPNEFLLSLKSQEYANKLSIFPVEETSQGWIFEEMQKAEAVWVTEDSISMIFEALTAGCRVGMIKIDRIKNDRITESVDHIIQQNLISDTTKIEKLPAAALFREADRIAKQLL
ncbi:ELM1/GtrOC1 family putative glycosyltransferase [Acinetobacter gerneri]|uniref:ELM1/GtrOC1 family putative glycosyltransferase n=1 Tax=Acinetobacter gerneri TaxID=202952 RepID=A0AAW8JF95_9GAMM|nr:ELM1/GtrOC1 family putative glycosyltransferase [Acinetobacter gerneri]MDQ9009303.1 ELM1/GtrOC1 family putative glycosyltransferase [Acinetobacter gerneri]MDQ9013495.1 ELM1/GtrOC1 family putative glycosyltransferase [Acinetobacter gerneri]MDQ9024777.1 ELM1/GtrOC1 family putative glycosyltransferase [Acinetobacter gerneri]MDQ9052167.1 ELM1/GtrOC1 family putative glycosyltransferase [Acinetobacter gerneri]MDQ9059478.1 ELM1/GtrOC1 family putative glycosyltransferase [Acinetobacter gerneri]